MNEEEIWQHNLVPKHRYVPEKEIVTKLDSMKITRNELMKILLNDPAIKALPEEIKIGDVVEITRKSQTAGVYTSYRQVVDL